MKHGAEAVSAENKPVDSEHLSTDEMLRYAHTLQLWKWTIVTGTGADKRERSFIAPRAEDALVMHRACNHFANYFEAHGLGLITDMRCEPLMVSGINNGSGEQK